MNFSKTKLVSILTAMVLSAGIIPAHAESTTIRFEGERGYSQSGGGVEIVENGTLARSMTQDATAREEGNVYLQYDIYVEEAGMYTMKWNSSVMSGNKYVSKATLSVNGVDVAAKQLSGPSGASQLGDHTANTYFEAGVNKVRFTINDTQRADGWAIFFLDYFEITPQTAVRYEAETSMVHSGSGWVGQPTIKYNVASDKTEMQSGMVYCEQTFDVTKPGVYKMTWRSTKNAGTKYVSAVTTSVNGVDIAAETAVADADPYYIQTAKITLVGGENKIRFTVNDTKNYGDGASAVFMLDYIDLEYIDSMARYDAPKGEGENPSGSGDANIKGDSYTQFSGGAIRRIWKDGSETTSLSIPCGGEFDMYLSLGADVDATYRPDGAYLGECSISIDGGEFIVLSGENCEYVKGFSGDGFYKNSAVWKYKPGVEFTAGVKTITVKCSGLGSRGNTSGNFILYDCVELVPKNATLGESVIKTSTNKLEVGNTLQTESGLYYTNGYRCTEDDITDVAFTSSDETVASIDKNGIMTGINPGIATITVTYNGTYSASTDITVYDESGIIPVSSSYDGAKAVLKFTRIADTMGTADVIIGAYSQEAGVDTSMTSVALEETVNPGYGNVVTVSKAITGDKITAYIWDSIDTMKPITNAIILK